jgi:hypothetical protein
MQLDRLALILGEHLSLDPERPASRGFRNHVGALVVP